MFKTQYSKHERRHAPSGDRMRVKYELVIDPDGNRRLEKSGIEDQYERIQSYKDGCTIENIVRRALMGDPDALSRAQGVYCDATLLPNDLIAADEAIRRAEAIYKALPASQRAEYGSFREFIGNFGSLEKIQAFLKPEKKKVSKKVEEGGAGDASKAIE